MSLLTAVASAACAMLLGGWEWALVCSIVLVVRPARTDFRSVLFTVAVGFLWLIAFCFTHDRRMVFPYTMQYAVQAAMLMHGSALVRGLMGGGAIVAVFMLIRVAQSAAISVLVVEVLVAAAVIALVMSAFGARKPSPGTRAIAGVGGSLLAVAGLVF
jgi:hypothetical protein